MSTRDMVSIIMPMKNALPYLHDCLDSIIDQSYSNWELIIVDDHCSDDGPETVQKLSKKDSRIKLIKNQRSGIISALQQGYNTSIGTFITRMDADDIMPKDKLNQMVHQLKNCGIGHIALGCVSYFRDDRAVGEGYRRYADWLNGLIQNGSCWDDIYKECVIPSPCWMVYQSDFERIGAFDSDRYPEDYDLAFRFYEHGMSCIPTSDIRHHWRDHSTRASRNDPNYSDNRFLDLKLDYFLKIDHNPDLELIIWGAGKKGKQVAKQLVERKVPFRWICNNDRKIAKQIYGVTLESIDIIQSEKQAQIIITVAGPADQTSIQQQLTGLSFNRDSVFFFC